MVIKVFPSASMSSPRLSWQSCTFRGGAGGVGVGGWTAGGVGAGGLEIGGVGRGDYFGAYDSPSPWWGLWP